MVFNHTARKLMLEAEPNVNLVVYDRFLYMVVSGCGGVVIYDPVPSLRYRQHATNLIGEKSGFIARLRRFGLMLSGRHQQWNARNMQALLNPCEKLIPKKNRSIYDE